MTHKFRFVSEGLKSKFLFIIIIKINNTYFPFIAEYWLNLGENVFFQGHRLVDCIARIRVDVLKIWNFNDPLEVSCVFDERTTDIKLTFIHQDTFWRGILGRDD